MYKIRHGALELYRQKYNSNEVIEDFLAKYMGEEIYLKSEIGEVVEVSRYENTKKVPLPFELLEEVEEDINETFLDKYKNKIFIGFAGLFVISLLIFSFMPGFDNNEKNKLINEKIQGIEDLIDKEAIYTLELDKKLQTIEQEKKLSEDKVTKYEEEIEELRKLKFLSDN